MTWLGTASEVKFSSGEQIFFTLPFLICTLKYSSTQLLQTHAHRLQNKCTGNPALPATWGDTKGDMQINVIK